MLSIEATSHFGGVVSKSEPKNHFPCSKSVFGPSAKQQDLYDQAVIPIVNEVLEGFNCTIFAYGQTGTGKTYTMEGECKRSKSGPNGELPRGAGVVPRAVKQIFDTLECQNAEYSVKVTFLELYNEEITDLLAPEELSKITLEEKQKKQLPLMEDGKGGYKRFFKRNALDISDYLKDDCLSIKCNVGVKSHTSGPKIFTIPVPPSNMGQHFGHL